MNADYRVTYVNDSRRRHHCAGGGVRRPHLRLTPDAAISSRAPLPAELFTPARSQTLTACRLALTPGYIVAYRVFTRLTDLPRRSRPLTAKRGDVSPPDALLRHRLLNISARLSANRAQPLRLPPPPPLRAITPSLITRAGSTSGKSSSSSIKASTCTLAARAYLKRIISGGSLVPVSYLESCV